MMADQEDFYTKIYWYSNDQLIQPDGNAKLNQIHIIPKTDLYYVGYETEDEYVAVNIMLIKATNTDTDETQQLNQSQVRQVDDHVTLWQLGFKPVRYTRDWFV